jgi:hypothetical protein
MPWSSPVSSADPLPCTMAVTSVCCRPITSCHGHHRCLLHILYHAPWQSPVAAATSFYGGHWSAEDRVPHPMVNSLVQTLYHALWQSLVSAVGLSPHDMAVTGVCYDLVTLPP